MKTLPAVLLAAVVLAAVVTAAAAGIRVSPPGTAQAAATPAQVAATVVESTAEPAASAPSRGRPFFSAAPVTSAFSAPVRARGGRIAGAACRRDCRAAWARERSRRRRTAI